MHCSSFRNYEKNDDIIKYNGIRILIKNGWTQITKSNENWRTQIGKSNENRRTQIGKSNENRRTQIGNLNY